MPVHDVGEAPQLLKFGEVGAAGRFLKRSDLLSVPGKKTVHDPDGEAAGRSTQRGRRRREGSDLRGRAAQAGNRSR